MTITEYYVIAETKEIIDVKTHETAEAKTGSSYVRNIDQITIEHNGQSYYLYYVLKDGIVKSAIYEGGINQVYYSVVHNDVVRDTWIYYYEKEGNYNPKPTMSLEKSDARIKFGDRIDTLNIIVEEKEDVDFINISIDTGTISGSFFSYGDTYSPTCNIEMTKCEYAKPGKYFSVEFKIDDIWRNFGIFKINGIPKKTSEYVNFSGAGMLESVLSSEDELLYNMSFSELTEYIMETYKIPLVVTFQDEIINLKPKYSNFQETYLSWWEDMKFYIPESLTEDDKEENVSVVSVKKPISAREYLSCIAIAFKANVIELNGVIYIQKRDENVVNSMFTNEQYAEEPEFNNTYYVPYPVTVSAKPTYLQKTDSEWYNDKALYLNSDNQKIEIINKPDYSSAGFEVITYPLTIESEESYLMVYPVKEEKMGYFADMPPYAASTMRAVTPYSPIEIQFIGYHPLIFSGSSVLLDINNGEAPFYIGNVNIEWDGGFTLSVSTPCDIQLQENTSQSFGNSSAAEKGNVTNPIIYKDAIVDKELNEKSTNAISNRAVATQINMFLKDYYHKITNISYNPELGDYNFLINKTIVKNMINSSLTVDTKEKWYFYTLENNLILFCAYGIGLYGTKDGFKSVFEANSYLPGKPVIVYCGYLNYVNGYLLYCENSADVHYTKDGINWGVNRIDSSGVEIKEIVCIDGIWFSKNKFSRSIENEFENIVPESDLFRPDVVSPSINGCEVSLPLSNVFYVIYVRNYYAGYLHLIYNDLSYKKIEFRSDSYSAYTNLIGIYGKNIIYEVSTSNTRYIYAKNIETEKISLVISGNNRIYTLENVLGKDNKYFYINEDDNFKYAVDIETLQTTSLPEFSYFEVSDRLYKQTEEIVYVQKKTSVEEYKPIFTVPYTKEEKNKLKTIEEGAEINVQPDWSEESETNDSFIKNKPDVKEETLDIDFSNYFV